MLSPETDHEEGAHERILPSVETIAFAMEAELFLKQAEARLAKKNGKGGSSPAETAAIIYARAQAEARAQAGEVFEGDTGESLTETLLVMNVVNVDHEECSEEDSDQHPGEVDDAFEEINSHLAKAERIVAGRVNDDAVEDPFLAQTEPLPPKAQVRFAAVEAPQKKAGDDVFDFLSE